MAIIMESTYLILALFNFSPNWGGLFWGHLLQV